MRYLAAGILFVGGLALAAWLGGYVMLYQGIVAAIAHPNAGSIIKAVFCEAGLIPGGILILIGALLVSEEF